MALALNIDWHSLFVPTVSLVEIFLRGSLVYLFLFFTFRLLRREAGELSISDLLLAVLIGDATQNAMSTHYESITEGLVLVATIFFWDYSLDWLGYKVEWIGRFINPPPLLLVKDGTMMLHNMRRELISRRELMSQLREQGVERLEEVKLSFMEPDGMISVIKKSKADEKGGKRTRAAK